MIERYSRPEMRQLWSLENKFRAWLEVELAVCEAWTKRGVIDVESMKTIRAKADFDLDRILEIEEQTRHDVIAFLTAVEEKVGEAARFIHLGCTSSDIVDTANGLLLTRASAIIDKGFVRVLAALKSLAEEYKGRLVMGRTHGVHAEPTSFGLKMAGFYAEFERAHHRFLDAAQGVRYGKISGAVGTYAHLDPAIESIACEILGLKVDPISTQIIQRDRHAAFFTSLALAAGGVERLCTELRHLQRTEVLEVEEGFAKGQKGSSAMPHKKNPISAENLCGLSRLLRSNALASMENMPLWHERDISHSSVERVIMPDSTMLMDYVLSRLAGLLEKLRILPENMERNLMGSQGLFFSQRVLVALLESGMGRQEAYELVQGVAMRCWEGKKPFKTLIEADAAIKKRLPPAKLKELFDLAYYLRYETMVYGRVFEDPAASDVLCWKKRLAKMLVEKSYREGDFILTSGKKTDYYFDCKQTALHPEGGQLIGKLFLELLEGAPISGVGGMTLGADPLVSAVSVLSAGTERPLPAFIVRKKSKGHGTDQFLEGLANFRPGDSVAMLEDVVTTGGTLITACERVKDAGFKIAGVYCVLDREEGGKQNLAKAGYALRSIFTRRELLEFARS
jgi:adenylosuccinate lyase